MLNNASDDARVQISDMLAEWRHPLDTRRKDDNRVRAHKRFSGEKWASFCADEAGSPGGPPAIAALMLIVAEDMQLNGNEVAKDAPSEKAKPAARGGRGGRGGRAANRGGRAAGRGGWNRAAFAVRQAAAAAETAIAEMLPLVMARERLTRLHLRRQQPPSISRPHLSSLQTPTVLRSFVCSSAPGHKPSSTRCWPLTLTSNGTLQAQRAFFLLA